MERITLNNYSLIGSTYSLNNKTTTKTKLTQGPLVYEQQRTPQKSPKSRTKRTPGR